MINFFRVITAAFGVLFCQFLFAVTLPQDIPSSVQIEVTAEVISPCEFNLDSNFLSFSVGKDEDNEALQDKALPITFGVNCPYASNYHYGFQTSEVDLLNKKSCAKGNNIDSDEYLLFCLRDPKGKQQDIVQNVEWNETDSYYTGAIPPGSPEGSFIQDTFLFYPQNIPPVGGSYTAMLTVVFFVD